ncbi:MAG: MFS transporter [Novosphingobium sp.]|nr:MFS transporter [Novosphingobium sp.]
MAWLTVGVLFLLYIRSLADRYLMALMVEPIKADLGLSDFQISLLQGPAFAVLYSICAVPVGLLLDRSSRRWVLFGCIVVWSAGAAACGLAATFAMLALGRSLVGAGEAGYTTGAYSIIGDSFPPQRVSLAMSIFVMGGVMGAGIVFLLGGPLVGIILEGKISHWPGLGMFKPWQQAFIVTGIPGIATALLVFLFPEPGRHKPAGATAGGGGYGEALRFIFSHPRCFSGIILGIGLVYTVTIALQLWSPTYLTRSFGWTPTQIGLAMGVAQMLPAFSLPVHGWVVDKLYAQGRTDAHLLWCLITLVMAAPFAIAAYLVGNPWYTVVLFGIYMVFILSSSSIGPAATQVVTPPELRGRVSAIFVLVTGLIGMALGTSLVGFFTDKVLGDPQKVGTSLILLISIVLTIAAVLFGMGRSSMRRLAETKDAQT